MRIMRTMIALVILALMGFAGSAASDTATQLVSYGTVDPTGFITVNPGSASLEWPTDTNEIDTEPYGSGPEDWSINTDLGGFTFQMRDASGQGGKMKSGSTFAPSPIEIKPWVGTESSPITLSNSLQTVTSDTFSPGTYTTTPYPVDLSYYMASLPSASSAWGITIEGYAYTP